MLEPGFPVGETFGSIRKIQDAALSESDVRSGSLVHPMPEAKGLDDKWEFTGVATLLTTPAPISGGLFPGDMTFFTEHYGQATLSQGQRSGHTDYAPTDDNNFGGFR